MGIILKSTRYIVVVAAILCITLVFCALWFVCSFHGDSYSNSETYIIDSSLQDAINQIDTLKASNPKYYFTNKNEKGEKYIVPDKYDEYVYNNYFVSFYFQDMNLVLQCVLEPWNGNKTAIRLYNISKGSRFATWQRINTKEIKKEENRKIKNKFETEILDKIYNGKWEHKRWYNW